MLALLASAVLQYDVVVAGGGVGGVSAAIAAARLGASVAVIEETDWIGGQATAAGVSTMDEAGFNTSSGLYAEFTDRVRVHYARMGKSIGTCASSPRKTCFEPHVGQRILREMIAEQPGVALLLRERVVAVEREGRRIVGVTTSKGNRIRTKVLIEATEYGDVLPLTGAGYRSGKYTSDNAERCCVQDITYVAIVKQYPDGVPAELRFTEPPPGYNDALRKRFAAFVTREGSETVRPYSWARHNSYRGLPDSSRPGSYTRNDFGRIAKTAINLANDFPVTTDIFDRRKRPALECQAKLLTLQFLYYMQKELGAADWAIADDEGYDTPYNREENSCGIIPAHLKPMERRMPVIPYVRESLRLIGRHTYSAPELQRTGLPPVAVKNWKSAIAVGDYPMDLHNCDRAGDLEKGLEKLSDRPRNFMAGLGPFQVPWETLVAKDVDGLLAVEKNISASRLVAGAVRLQPVSMLTGQAAGITAGILVKTGTVRVEQVQRHLLEAGSRLTPLDYLDVPKQVTHWAAIQFAVVHDLLVPESANVFGQDRPLTRAQFQRLMSILAPGQKIAGEDGNRVFLDEFRDGMRRAIGRDPGIAVPNPEAGITRATAATHLYRLLSE